MSGLKEQGWKVQSLVLTLFRGWAFGHHQSLKPIVRQKSLEVIPVLQHELARLYQKLELAEKSYQRNKEQSHD